MSTSGARGAYHHGNLRAVLVAAARAQLETAGSERLTLRAVAGAAGVSAMAPYRHFADKAALLAAVAAEGFQELAQRLTDADSSASGPAALAAQGVAYVVFALSHPSLFRVMFGARHLHGSELAQTGERAYAVLSDRVACLVSADAAADAALAAWSLVHGLALLMLDGRIDPGREAPERLAARITGMIAALVASRG